MFAIHALTTLQNTHSINNIIVKGYPTHDIDDFLIQCYNNKLLVGIACYHDANGNPHIEKIGTPTLTIDGFQYLNNLYAKSARKLHVIQ